MLDTNWGGPFIFLRGKNMIMPYITQQTVRNWELSMMNTSHEI